MHVRRLLDIYKRNFAQKANYFYLLFPFAFHLILNDCRSTHSNVHVLLNLIIDNPRELRWIHIQPSPCHSRKELHSSIASSSSSLSQADSLLHFLSTLMILVLKKSREGKNQRLKSAS